VVTDTFGKHLELGVAVVILAARAVELPARHGVLRPPHS
jgi:hypothetical protein